MTIREATELEALQEYDMEMQACFRSHEMEEDKDDNILIITQH